MGKERKLAAHSEVCQSVGGLISFLSKGIPLSSLHWGALLKFPLAIQCTEILYSITFHCACHKYVLYADVGENSPRQSAFPSVENSPEGIDTFTAIQCVILDHRGIIKITAVMSTSLAETITRFGNLFPVLYRKNRKTLMLCHGARFYSLTLYLPT